MNTPRLDLGICTKWFLGWLRTMDSGRFSSGELSSEDSLMR